MAPKRKRATSIPDEERVVKRQLRSGREVELSPMKPTTETRRALQSPRKRASSAKKINEEQQNGNDADETAANSTSQTQEHIPAFQTTTSVPETRCFSDETNLFQSSGSIVLDNSTLRAEKPRARRGRPPKTSSTGLEVNTSVFHQTAVAESDNIPNIVEPNVSLRHPTRGSSTTVEVVICRPSKTIYQTPAPTAKKQPALDESDSSDNEPATSNIGRNTRKPASSRVTRKATRNGQEKAELSGLSDTEHTQEEPPTLTPTKKAKNTLVLWTLSKDARKRGLEPESSIAAELTQAAGTPSKRVKKTPASQATPNLIKVIGAPPRELYVPSSQEQPVLRPDPVIQTERNTFNLDDEDKEVEISALTSNPIKPSRSRPLPDLSSVLPMHLHSCLNAYKGEILKNFQFSNAVTPRTDLDPSPNDIAEKQLTDLIDGTVLRAEGNSCLLLGPRGSGKSQMVERCLEKVAFQKPIVLRLSGWVQHTDRHALSEIAFQLLQQTGSSLLPDSETGLSNPVNENKEEENPFLETTSAEFNITLPPSSHLHALIPVLLTLSRPVIVILDAFDLFSLHPRQSLLYCLLDTVQNCRASSESRGLTVIGVTSRIDTVQLLEKRVKSRFSGRTIRTAPPGDLQSSLALVKSILQPSGVCSDEELEEEWNDRWRLSVDKFLADKNVLGAFDETFSLTRNFRVIIRILTTCVLRLTPSHPYLSFKAMSACVDIQRSRPRTLHLANPSYPWLCLLIACAHANTAEHPNFTFEMLYETFRDQVRGSGSAPVQVNGGNIGMVRCTREVLISTFEEMTAARIFICTVAPSPNVAKEFMKHRCSVSFHDIKAIIDKSGQTNLKKWLNKGN